MNLAPSGNFSALEVLALIVALLGTVLYLMVAFVLFRRSTKNYEEWVVSFASLALLARALIGRISDLFNLRIALLTTGVGNILCVLCFVLAIFKIKRD